MYAGALGEGHGVCTRISSPVCHNLSGFAYSKCGFISVFPTIFFVIKKIEKRLANFISLFPTFFFAVKTIRSDLPILMHPNISREVDEAASSDQIPPVRKLFPGNPTHAAVRNERIGLADRLPVTEHTPPLVSPNNTD